MKKEIYTAIIFFKYSENKNPIKYRNIVNIEKFLIYAKNSGAWYANIYFKKDKKFAYRQYLTNDF